MKKSVLSLLVFALSFNLAAQSKANAPELKMTLEGSSITFVWDLSREINTSYFVLEHAPIGRADFKPVHSEKAQGYSHFATNYNYEHFALASDFKYRIVLVMMDGTRIFSNTLSLPATEMKSIDTTNSIVTK